jgi:hypothetical protein
MHSNQVGGISETTIVLDLLKQGYNVLEPMIPTRYDRLVEVGEREFTRIQIKTARIDRRDGNLRVTFEEPYTPGQIDFFAVYAPFNDEVYYIPVEDVQAGAKGFTIRLTPRKNKRKTNSLPADCYLNFAI